MIWAYRLLGVRYQANKHTHTFVASSHQFIDWWGGGQRRRVVKIILNLLSQYDVSSAVSTCNLLCWHCPSDVIIRQPRPCLIQRVWTCDTCTHGLLVCWQNDNHSMETEVEGRTFSKGAAKATPSDFELLKVLGQGSFGKVSTDSFGMVYTAEVGKLAPVHGRRLTVWIVSSRNDCRDVAVHVVSVVVYVRVITKL